MALDIIARAMAVGGKLVGAGALGTPVLTLAGDTGTGWFRSASNQWSWVASNSARFNLAFSAIRMASTIPFGWTSGEATATADTVLNRDAANTLALRNGTAAQAYKWYHTYTDASNYQRGALKTAAGYVEVAAETAGTGATDVDVLLTPAGAGRVRFGTLSAIAAETVTGYLTVKDAGGTSRKIAVVA